MESHLVVVTGGSAGIGRALLAAAPAGSTRIDVSRRGTDLEGVRHVAADLADPSEWAGVAGAIATELTSQAWQRVTVVHAAGTLDPIGYAAEVDATAYAAAVLLNSAAPQALGQHVLTALADMDVPRDLVVLTSGAARTSYPGWSMYNAGKAAVDQWVRTVGAEQSDRGGVRVLAIAPGVVATGMQELIRRTSPRDFPRVERFRRLHEEGALAEPEDVARRLWRLLGDPDVSTGSVLDLREQR